MNGGHDMSGKGFPLEKVYILSRYADYRWHVAGSARKLTFNVMMYLFLKLVARLFSGQRIWKSGICGWMRKRGEMN